MNKKLTINTGMLILVLFACAGPGTVRKHPDFHVRAESVRTVLLVDQDVKVVQKTSGSTDRPLPDIVDKVAAALRTLITNELSKRGFEVKARNAYDTDQDTARKSFAYASQIQTSYDQLTRTLYGPEQPTTSQTYTIKLEPEALEWIKMTTTDAFLCVKLDGFTRPGSDIAGEVIQKTLISLLTMGLVTQYANPYAGALVLDVALIEGKTGDVLWANLAGDSFLLPPDFSKELPELVEKLFALFPLSKTVMEEARR